MDLLGRFGELRLWHCNPDSVFDRFGYALPFVLRFWQRNVLARVSETSGQVNHVTL